LKVYIAEGGGDIELIDSMGSDIDIVNAAKVSVGKQVDVLGIKEIKLLKYLYDHKHTSPFEMVELKFRVKAPLFVIRQWQRHRTWSYNEVSRRYTSDRMEFYYPSRMRKQAQFNRQSSLPKVFQLGYEDDIARHTQAAYGLYTCMLDSGVCREQARMVLPQNMMVEMVAKVDLRNLLHFLELRLADGAQIEIQLYAMAIVEILHEVVPETMKIFLDKLHKTC